MANTQKRIVIVGAGFGGVYAHKHLHRAFHKSKNISITVINEQNYFLFTPLLHEVATGGQSRQNIVEPLRKELCCLADLYVERAREVNPKKQVIAVDGREIPYDYLVLAPGAGTNFFGTKGAEKHSFTLKSVSDAIGLKNHVIRCIENASHQEQCAERESGLTFTVVGGGATGVELAAELVEFAKSAFAPLYPNIDLARLVRVILAQSNEELIPQFHPKLRKKAHDILRKKGIDIRLNTKVASITGDSVTFDTKETIHTRTVVWTAGVSPRIVPFTTPVALAKNGAYEVNQYLQLKSHQNIFALGDASYFVNPGEEKPVPQHAQTAVAQAQQVAENIIRSIKKKPLKAYRYTHKGDLISLGRWRAGGSVAGITFSGRFTWWLWRTVYLFALLSWRKKILVAVDWTLNIFAKRDVSEL